MRLEPPTPKKRPPGHRAVTNRHMHENEPGQEYSGRDLSNNRKYIYSHMLQLKKGQMAFQSAICGQIFRVDVWNFKDNSHIHRLAHHPPRRHREQALHVGNTQQCR